MSLLYLLVSLAELLPPQQTHRGEEGASHDGLVEDHQHLAAHIKGSQLPQEVESTTACLLHSSAIGPQDS